MNLLDIRSLIYNALTGVKKLDLSQVRNVEHCNPTYVPGDWGLLITVNDGTGQDRTFYAVLREAEHIAQFRVSKKHKWTYVGKGLDASEVAWVLDEPMQRHGFRYSEMAEHRKDLEAGHVLTADDGYQFRVVLEGRDNSE